MQKFACFALIAACLIVAASNASCPTVTGDTITLSDIAYDYYLVYETNRPWFFPKKCTVNSYTAETDSLDLTQSYRYSWFPFSLFKHSKSYDVTLLSTNTSINQQQTSGWLFKSDTDYTVITSVTDEYMVLYTCKSGLLGFYKEKILVFSTSKTLSSTYLTAVKEALEDQSLSTNLKTHPQTC